MVKYSWILILIMVWSCELREAVDLNEDSNNIVNCDNPIVSSGKYYELSGETYLWGDEDSSKHFNITDWSLDVCKLRHGFGREFFQALVEPTFQPISEVQYSYSTQDRAVIVNSEEGMKVYPLGLLVAYESVNDVVEGNPILVVYCHLANLVSVYDRNYCGTTLTFAVSGYTYLDTAIKDEAQSFILWDRNTESLWWPITDVGVSGNFKGYTMNKYNINKWEILNMVEIAQRYPNAQVLVAGQRVNPPIIPVFEGC